MCLSVEHLSVSIHGNPILRDISLRFPKGKRISILGPNGAGKSTLLRTLIGIQQLEAGCVLLQGTDIKRLSRRQLSQNIAILPQGAEAPQDTTVEHLVGFGRFPYHSMFGQVDAKKDREVVEWALDLAHVEALRKREVHSLSGGERQRAFLAMVLAQQPKILLLDEPTTYLDIAHQLEVMNIITEVNQKYGITVIMVLHDMNHALQFSDEVVIVKNHGIFASGSPETIMTAETIAKVFGVQVDTFANSAGKIMLFPVRLVGQQEERG